MPMPRQVDTPPRDAGPLRRRIAAIAVAAAFACAAAAAQPRFDFDRTPGTLPKTVLPTRQAITLTVDPASDRFSGESTLAVRLRSDVPAVVLNAHRLTPKGGATLTIAGRERRLTVKADPQAQLWRLVPDDGEPLPAGEATLAIAWEGSVQHSAAGLYRAPYGGATPGAMLATQLQAVHARMVFPAFDEPAFRTVFELAVRAPRELDVVSNTEETATVDEGATRLHRFAPTPPMPSYLVALAAGRFDAIAGEAAGVPLRVLAAPGKAAFGAYALAATRDLVAYYADYFGQPYTLAKLDQLAVPSTRWGAMEDWGLVSYAEGTLLFDPARSDAKTQRRVYGIVAHELAHQWFGNLVTAASWDEIWLNEAFAEWLGEKATDRFNPDWQAALRRRVPIDEAMRRDAGPATRAIRSGPVAEDRVFDVFDDITYTKGGAVLAMLEGWLGEQAFRRGLAAYVADRKLSNATAGDLWHQLARASGEDVAAVASSWTDQPGLPLVAASTRCAGSQTRLELTQRRFRLDGRDAPGLWRIPVVVRHGERTEALLLARAHGSWRLPGCPAEPTLLNPGGTGFYRVAYPPPARAELVRGFAALPATAQATLLSDTFALAESGALPLADALQLLAALPAVGGPGRPALYAQAANALGELDDVFAGSAAEPALHAAARALLAPELAAIGWQATAGEGSEVEALRTTLIEQLARHGDEATIARARALFDDAHAGGAPLPASIRAGVVRAVGWQADSARFAVLVERLRTADRDEDRWLYASAAARAPEAGMIDSLLRLTLDPAVPTNIAAELPAMVGRGPHHAGLAYHFVVSKHRQLGERIDATPGAGAWLLPGAAAGFVDAGAARRLLADQQRLVGAPGSAAAKQTAAGIELKTALRGREASRVGPAFAALAVALVKQTGSR